MSFIRNLRRIMCFFIALFMIFGISVSTYSNEVQANGNYSVKVKGLNGHKLEFYQIFSGDISEGVLSNIKWGNGINTSKLKEFGINENAQNVAEELNEEGKDSVKSQEFASNISNVLSNIKIVADIKSDDETIELKDAGYYLIKDSADSFEGKDNSYTRYILAVTNDNVEIKGKTGTPELEKFIYEENSSYPGNSKWAKGADHFIKHDVGFKLKIKLPNNFDSYKGYKINIHDSLSDSFDNIKDLKITLGRYKNENKEVDITKFFNQNVSDVKNMSFVVNNLKSQEILNYLKSQYPEYQLSSNSEVYVTYTAEFKDNAVIGNTDKNINTAYMEYSNNPNFSGNGENSPLGRTPDKKVYAYTFKLKVNKTDGEKPLKGAQFKLFKVNNYNKDLIENHYNELYKNDKIFKSGELYMEEIDGQNIGLTDVQNETEFNFTGLDSGVYILVETKAPLKYNKIDPIVFEVKSDISEEGIINLLDANYIKNGNSKDVNITTDLKSGEMVFDVVNRKGATLPETGGTGTKVIYTVGGIAIIGALGYFIAQKKYDKNN